MVHAKERELAQLRAELDAEKMKSHQLQSQLLHEQGEKQAKEVQNVSLLKEGQSNLDELNVRRAIQGPKDAAVPPAAVRLNAAAGSLPAPLTYLLWSDLLQP